MAAELKPVVHTAQLRRVCCNHKPGGPAIRSTAGAHWELYLVVYNTTDEWPAYKWPKSRRHQVPTPDERTAALTELGYAPAPDAEWEWQESQTPDYHGHPSAVSLFGTVNIVPLEQAKSAEDGDV
ncbi:DUF6303 family protein [Streptomyces sp. NPDC046909]|uniref:DUF6303 family protein n=1 Tax=Streptomyces sp. NPDC046909 TaxID=3155617 RepID=UPI0033C5A7C1